MTDQKPRQGDPTTETVSMPMCPMGETCKRMMENPPSRFLMFVPGVVFIVVGILIVIEPGILVWLIAIGLILMGIAMLGCAYFMRAAGARFMRAYQQGDWR